MKRGWLLLLLVGISLSCLFGSGAASGVEAKKEEKKEKDDILGKSIGEWIKILRTHEQAKWRRAALIALEYGNAASRSGLLAILDAVEKDADPQVRQEAVKLLARLGPDTKGTFLAILGRLQNDKADSVREAAASALGTNDKFMERAADYVYVLEGALKDAHPGTRGAAATTLRKMGEYAKPAMPALIEAAKKPKEIPLVRIEAIHVISRYGKDNAQMLPLLVEIVLNEESPAGVREAAAEALGRAGKDAPEAADALGKTLAAKNIELRKASALALSGFGIKAKSAWPAIKTRLGKTEVKSTETAKPVEADSFLRNHLIRLTGVLAKEKADAIPVLANLAAEDESTENRLAAIQELGELGPLAKDALPVLSNLATQDVRATVRDAAAKAMTQIKGK